MSRINRRDFVKGAAVVVAAGGAASAYQANDKVVVGVMGLGGRGTLLAEKFAQQKNIEIAYLCDVDNRRFARAREAVQEAQGRNPKVVQDFRKILEDPAVNALINATPDHWHALGTIMACQAGKDVYVEKPLAYCAWEGRKMVEAARKYKRIVQVGMQTRSSAYIKTAREFIQSGKLGDVYMIRVYNMMQHPAQQQGQEVPVPQGFDYDMWCGPAAKLPYTTGRTWLNTWEYSCGPIAGDAVHQLDLARYLMGDPAYPKTVMHTGGIFSLRDGRDMPDTQVASYEYDNFILLFQASLWTPYMKKIPANVRDGDLFPDWPWCATKIEVVGTKAYMLFGRHGGGWQAFDEEHKVVGESFGRQGDAPHIQNFADCIRSRELPAADVEQGHHSVMLSHMANISWRVGNRKLALDPKTETFPESEEANKFLKRAVYRAPWVVPENV